ncbi:MAG: secondary thiamine-phosphate synthase enzyme YjbQ [Candidatus Woesearchaeota archaeon]|nr:secondary thiamine-phosphate synthase enzyme YjbQ [Candidatus Woesearchaeota archaeon]
MAELHIKTECREGLIDITPEIEKILTKISKRDGFLLILSKHTTASIIINEGEEGLKRDIMLSLSGIVPKGKYEHNRIDSNAEAHIKSAIIGAEKLVPVKKGKMELGTWQRIMLAEFDGPRERTISINFIPAKGGRNAK